MSAQTKPKMHGSAIRVRNLFWMPVIWRFRKIPDTLIFIAYPVAGADGSLLYRNNLVFAPRHRSGGYSV